MHNKKGVESVIVDSLINILKRQIRHEEKINHIINVDSWKNIIFVPLFRKEAAQNHVRELMFFI